ncbi:MAG TPA: hypothetical protein VK964_19690 [Nocardioidaceae bacterium]|nr:hypothetical protein [Nocardioidaceae bacterium]
MRDRPRRLTAYSAFAALTLGAVGMAFERAGPSVMAADPDDFAAWAGKHHRALTTQSGVFLVSTAPLLLFFAGLRSWLRPHQDPAARVDLSLAVLGGGSLWALGSAAAQTVQASMARSAASGAEAEAVAALGQRMRAMLVRSNAALSGAMAATAAATFRDGALPRWLGWLSAAGAVAHLAPMTTRRLENLPYPFFVAWLVAVAVVLARRPGRSI